jgi:hypothetical protein
MGVRAVVTMTTGFGDVADQILAGIVVGENQAAERLLALAIPRTPLQDGALRGSGHVEQASDAEEGAAVVFDTPYAARLHEHPEYSFTGPGTGGKYLENPALENKQELGDIIRKAARP